VKLNLLGHNAEVVNIEGKIALPPWHPEDYLQIWIDLKEPVDGTMGFGIIIPPKEYSPEELQQIIQKEASNTLLGIQEKNRRNHERQKVERQKLKEIEQLAKKLETYI
jgi:hypothetical protein